MTKRRKIVWFVCGGIALLAITGCAAILGRHRSQFEYLYELGPAVGEFTPKPLAMSIGGTVTVGSSIVRSGGTTVRYFVGPGGFGATAPQPQTVLVFKSEQFERVQKLLRSKRPAFAAASFHGAPTDSNLWSFNDGKATLLFATGSFAKDIADQAHLPVPKGGCVVTITEPPDWFTARLHAVMKFLRLE